MAQIFAGLLVEGSTDTVFLQNIVQKTIESVAFECKGQIDIEVLPIEINKTGLNFPEQVITAAKKGMDDYGIQIICVHADADHTNSSNTYGYKINPAKAELSAQNPNEYCTILVALVPVREMEAWILADKELLKSEIGTTKSDTELGIHRAPESIANPKEVIESAIRIARADMTKKRRHTLTLLDLYLPLGVSMDMQKLEKLPSYQDFKSNIRNAFVALNLL
jgi:Domain of unknown function (DUF4276)